MAGVILSIGGNALGMFFVEYEQVLWLRVATGIGSGIFTAVAVVSLGGTTKPVRAFNGLSAVCLFFLHWLPARPLTEQELAQQEAGEDHVENWHVPKALPIICLVAVCFTYINIGGLHLHRISRHADGIAGDWMGHVLTWSSIFAMVVHICHGRLCDCIRVYTLWLVQAVVCVTAADGAHRHHAQWRHYR